MNFDNFLERLHDFAFVVSICGFIVALSPLGAPLTANVETLRQIIGENLPAALWLV